MGNNVVTRIAEILGVIALLVGVAWWAAGIDNDVRAADKDIRDAKVIHTQQAEILDRLSGYHTKHQIQQRERQRLQRCYEGGVQPKDCPEEIN